MLKLNQVTLRRGLKVLFEGVDLTIHNGQRVGVTGANGSGKSSLFALFLSKLEVDEGEMANSRGLVFASTDQEVEGVERIARDYVVDGDTALRDIENQLQQAQKSDNGHKHAELLTLFEQKEGYTANSRAGTLLHGLGFTEVQQQLPVSEFSGGWRMRLNLARALMSPSDVLLLDEPTNHLDLDAVLWLETWLLRYQGTLLLISHDREFLDRVATHIIHIEQEQIQIYTGNYSDFEKLRAEKLSSQQANYQRQQREIAHMQSFITRFKAKATKAKQAQSRIRALERMEVISPAHVDSQFQFSFRNPDDLPDPLVIMEEVNCGYPDACIVSNVNATIRSGDKIGLLGINGAGKSTFVRTLVGELESLNGNIKTAKKINIAYFAQHQLEQLPSEESVLSYLQSIAQNATESVVRDYAGGFGFRGDRVFDQINILSGGEKARLVLAGIVYQKPNLLLLDEPTNHLDIEMRHALTVALQDYNGALIMVSHDRHLLRCTVDQLWLVAQGSLILFDSDLDAYTTWIKEQRLLDATAHSQSIDKSENSAADRKQRKRQEADARKKIQPLKMKVRKLEKTLEDSVKKLVYIQEKLADSSLYQNENKQDLQTFLKKQASIKTTIETLEEDCLLALDEYEKASMEAGI